MRRHVTALLAAVIAVGLWAGVAAADETYPAPKPDPTVTTMQESDIVADQPAAGPSELPFTGGDALWLGLIGLGLVGAGAAMVVVRRTRTGELSS